MAQSDVLPKNANVEYNFAYKMHKLRESDLRRNQRTIAKKNDKLKNTGSEILSTIIRETAV